jgi:hemerythrin-like metal-binding protein
VQVSELQIRRIAAAALHLQATMGRIHMAQFSWTDDLHTRNALIDGDHRELIRLINVLFDAMASARADDGMRRAMNDLVAYTKEHFAREETEMQRIRYVASLAHKGEHRKLLRQLIELKAILDAGGRINIPAVSDYLSAWLRDHILTADIKLATALKQQRSAEPAP